jgi:4-hydroxy-tetrahydrodipicolinate synthase
MGTEGQAWLKGISGVPVTPFKQGAAVDEEVLGGVVRRMVAAGVNVIVACGNTSEYGSLTSDEARRVAAATIEAAGTCPVLVGVGGDLQTACQEAQLGTARGAKGVMVHFPSDPYLSEKGLMGYYARLAGNVDGAVVVYVRGRGLPDDVLDFVVARDNVVGIKYAIPDVLSFGRLVRRYGGAAVPLCGLAEMWAPFFWIVGAEGFTSGLVNVAPELSLALLSALRAGETKVAMEIWGSVRAFEELRARDGNAMNVPVVKHAMVVKGLLEDGSVRPPISDLSEGERRQLAATLESWQGAF